MKLCFLGAAHEVTGSCTLLYAAGKKILIDCGMEQGADTYENCPPPVSPADIDFVLLTHAHIDHSGRLPVLTAKGYTGEIYTTEATARLCGIMLMDSAHIQQSEAQWRNKKAKRAGKPPYVPPYTTDDVSGMLKQLVPCKYQNTYRLCEGVSVRFLDAGHLLGSASIELTVTEEGTTKTILFSGDIGNVSRPLIRDPQKPEKADIVVMESTYGDRLHGERSDYVSQLSAIIQKTMSRGGNVVIPSFAVGRTQELLYLIHEIKEKHLVTALPDFQVWIDSPLAVEATRIYSDDMVEYYDEQTLALLKKGIDILNFRGLHFAVTSAESMALNEDKTPKVIISSSGMCEAGRIRHHLKHNLWREDSTILFVGYQSAGTLGRTLLDGAEKVKLFGEEITVKAEIQKMDGISGHADKAMLLAWLKNIKTPVSRVYVNHGDDLVCEEFAAAIKQELSMDAIAPFNGAEYDLLTGACLEKGNTVKKAKESKQRGAVSALFERLVQAGKRLLCVIEKNKELSNKELAQFTDEIDELSRKWDQ